MVFLFIYANQLSDNYKNLEMCSREFSYKGEIINSPSEEDKRIQFGLNKDNQFVLSQDYTHINRHKYRLANNNHDDANSDTKNIQSKYPTWCSRYLFD